MSDAPERLDAALSGRYRIERELGTGGMATVYLAEDLRHDRKVALKVLKPELAAVVGAERFLAEIKTTANLQHPHILPLFDSGEADGFLFYVMPFVEGESLRERLDREKQLPVETAVSITTQVAEALDYAHRHGVIHRDIKPANIMTQDGQPVIADFGIALAVGAASGTRLTETGLSVGTPYYMSPEQATGDQEVGPPSDTYSLACVLYEMLVGDPPYVGSTAQAVLGQIIAGEVKPATATRAAVPPNVDHALRRALEKLPADRFPSAREFARALTDPGFRYRDPVAAAVTSTGAWGRLGPALVALSVVTTTVAAWALTRPPDAGPVTRFMVAFTPDQTLWYTGTANPPRISITPDGSRFVYVGRSSPREGLLWVRALDQLEGQPLNGTENAVAPRVAPDGQRVAFLSGSTGRGRSLRVVSLSGGTPVMLVPSGVGSPPTWGADGFLYWIADDGVTLRRVPGGGGTVESVATLDLGERFTGYTHPFLLPDGNAVVVTALPVDPTAPVETHVVDLATGTSAASVLGTAGRLTPEGWFVYVTADGTMMAQDFDSGSLTLEGNPTPLVFGVDVRANGIVDVTMSENGTLLYLLENTQAPERWVWVDEDGGTELVDPNWTQDDEFESVALSPDGARLAVELSKEGRYDIWIKRLAGGAPSRLTFRGDRNSHPAWSPDGERVAFVSISTAGRDAWVRRADGSGSAEPLLDLEVDVHEVLWSHGGEWLLAVVDGPSLDIVAVRDGDEDPVALRDGPFDEFEPALSPDDRWLAYVSDETGRVEVFVVPFPNVGDGKWQISRDGGREPHWSADGRRLYVRHEDGSGIDVVDMSEGPIAPARRTFFDVPPEEYFELNTTTDMSDLASDGRVLMLRAGTGDISGELVIVQNWFTEVEARLRASGR